MILDFPRIQVPDSLAQICKMTLKNKRQTFSDIIQVVERDPFLNQYLHQNYKKDLERSNLIGVTTSMGWESFRNRLTEMYIHHAHYNNYQFIQEIDEVFDILDLEKRFDFLYPEGNSRIFLLGTYLKMSDIYIENSYDHEGGEFLNIPVEVDEILHKSKKRTVFPDWLILFTWSLVLMLGEERTNSLFRATKGDLALTLSHLSTEEAQAIFNVLIRYAYGISDKEFLTSEKI